MNCSACGGPIEEGGRCLQVRAGYLEGGEFQAEEDVAYYHPECADDRIVVIKR